MRVFITGASGWIGSAVTGEVLAAGHEVMGLARSDSAAAALQARGAVVRRGDLDDLAGLRDGALESDAVIHLANKHDFTNPAVSNAAERAAVETIGEALTGSGKSFLVASGMRNGLGRAATEEDPSPFHGPATPRGGSENRALDFVSDGVGTVILRFSTTVHGAGDHGFIAALVAIARERGFSGYVGDGTNCWPAVHRSDAARLVLLGLESASPGSVLHAVGEGAVPTRDIAAAIGRGLGLPTRSVEPDDATGHFGWLGMFFGMDIQGSSAITQERFDWTPNGPTLIDDISSGAYFPVEARA